MSANKRPLSVAIVGCLYLAVGITGFIYHFKELLGQGALHNDGIWIELTEAVAGVSGAFLLLGRNWARWIALAWMVFHVVLSAFHSVREFSIHFLICAVIAWFLFRPPAARYFLIGRAEKG